MILLAWNVQATVLLVLPVITKLVDFWQEAVVCVRVALLIFTSMEVVRPATIRALLVMEFSTQIATPAPQTEHC